MMCMIFSVLRDVFGHMAGTFFFRFGWRGRGVQEEHWYREANE